MYDLPTWEAYYVRLLKRIPRSSPLFLEIRKLANHHLQTMQVSNSNYCLAEKAYNLGNTFEQMVSGYRTALSNVSLN